MSVTQKHGGFRGSVLVPNAASTNVPTKSGYLKKRNNMGIYQKRYFVTVNRYVNYFASEKMEALLGSVNLSEILQITDADNSFMFELKAEKAGMKLKATNQKEALEWVQTLRIRWDVIAKSSAGMPSAAPYLTARTAPALSVIPETGDGQFAYQRVLPPPSGPPPESNGPPPSVSADSRSSLISAFGLTEGAVQRTAQRAMSVLDKNSTRQGRMSTQPQGVLPPPSGPPPVILPPPSLPPPPLTELKQEQKPQFQLVDGVRILVYDRADLADQEDDDDDDVQAGAITNLVGGGQEGMSEKEKKLLLEQEQVEMQELRIAQEGGGSRMKAPVTKVTGEWLCCNDEDQDDGSEETAVGGTGNGTGKDRCLNVGVASMQGWRRTMEDSHLAEMNIKGLQAHRLFAVFDGHGGSYAARYAEQYLLSTIEAQLPFEQYKESERQRRERKGGGGEGDAEQDESSIKLLRLATVQAFLEVDEQLRRSHKVRSGGDHSGCTAVVVWLTPSFILYAWCGDSRVTLSAAPLSAREERAARGIGNGGSVSGASAVAGGVEVLRLSEDHKPSHRRERARIEENGGIVIAGTGGMSDRVRLVGVGSLGVSRAIGDPEYKAAANAAGRSADVADGNVAVAAAGAVVSAPSMSCLQWSSPRYAAMASRQEKCLVSALPDVGYRRRRRRRDKGAGAGVGATQLVDRYLVVACDGIWDVLSDEKCCEIVHEKCAAAAPEPKTCEEEVQLTNGGSAGGAGTNAGVSVVNVQGMAASMLHCCLEAGSNDNMTLLVVELDADGSP
jgi:serine/threonine protein phosphatase PrpC